MSKTDNFNPMRFLASVGAGGMAIAPFAFFQYTYHTGKGLVSYGAINHDMLPTSQLALFRGLEAIMIIMALLHFVISISLFKDLIPWLASEKFKELKTNPLKNAAILVPFVSFAMTMNVFIAVIRFFSPTLHTNFQSLMLPALIVWGLLWVTQMYTEMKLLKISFIKDFDINKIGFTWLMHPFALAMLTVTGTGLAAMAKDPNVAKVAAFMSLTSGSMGVFLFAVKLFASFTSHFKKDGLDDKQFLPSYLMVVPIITLYAISAFRLGHFAEHHMGLHLHGYFTAVIALAFTFQTWYLMFGLTLLKDYFKQDFAKNEYYVSLWGLICPFAGYAVMGSFFYKNVISSPILYAAIPLITLAGVFTYGVILRRSLGCQGLIKGKTACIN